MRLNTLNRLSKLRFYMLVLCGMLFFVNLGFVIGDLYYRQWNSLWRDLSIAASFAVIWLTWKFLFK